MKKIIECPVIYKYDAKGNKYIINHEINDFEVVASKIYLNAENKELVDKSTSIIDIRHLFDEPVRSVADQKLETANKELNKIVDRHSKLKSELKDIELKIKQQQSILKRSEFISSIKCEETQKQFFNIISGKAKYIVRDTYVYDVDKYTKSDYDGEVKAVIISQNWKGEFSLKLSMYNDGSGNKDNILVANTKKEAYDFLVQNVQQRGENSRASFYENLVDQFDKIGLGTPDFITQKIKELKTKELNVYLLDIEQRKENAINELKKLESL